MSVIDTLKERGYLKQLSHEEEIKELLEKEKITYYIGFDPTADSLHVGHFIALMVMAHMQRAGHRPIILMGGGTGMIGDPSGKNEMRKMLTPEFIHHNVECFKKQVGRFIDLSDGKAIVADNADWLLGLNYIKFLREVGVHFSVNRMLGAECYKNRLASENGLSFFEMNYMIMELIRRKDRQPAFCMTNTLLTNSQGQKMGKTVGGAVWLSAEKTSPFDFYQYWRNVDDADVEKCLALLTFLPMDEVRRLGALEGSKINEAKVTLAYEVTKLVHGKEEADKAKAAAEALFGAGGDMGNAPVVEVTKEQFGSPLLDLLFDAKIIASKSEGRRLIQQNGLTVGDTKVTDVAAALSETLFEGKTEVLLRKGKKKYYRLILK